MDDSKCLRYKNTILKFNFVVKFILYVKITSPKNFFKLSATKKKSTVLQL